jgi:hypothetical protein
LSSYLSACPINIKVSKRAQEEVYAAFPVLDFLDIVSELPSLFNPIDFKRFLRAVAKGFKACACRCKCFRKNDGDELKLNEYPIMYTRAEDTVDVDLAEDSAEVGTTHRYPDEDASNRGSGGVEAASPDKVPHTPFYLRQSPLPWGTLRDPQSSVSKFRLITVGLSHNFFKYFCDVLSLSLLRFSTTSIGLLRLRRLYFVEIWQRIFS